MNVYTIRGHIGACKWKSNAYIAGPIFCNKLNSSKCRLLVNKANLVHNLFLVYGRPESHPHRITSTKCHINTAVSPDGHIVA